MTYCCLQAITIMGDSNNEIKDINWNIIRGLDKIKYLILIIDKFLFILK